MNHDDEIKALMQHFDARGLDQAEAANIVTTWLGITIGMAAPDDEGVKHRVEVITGWITDAARRIVRTLGGDSGERVQ